MIDVKIQYYELHDKRDQILIADLKTAIYNGPIGPYLKKGTDYPFKIKDFLPKNLRHTREVISESEKTKRWMAAGDAMMAVVEEHERETGVKV